MKRYLLLLLLFIPLIANAQAYKFKATSIAYREYSEYSGWKEWSDWKRTDILVVVNFNDDKITIYSKEMQEFDLVEVIKDNERDNTGGTTTTLLAVDIDGLRNYIRLRMGSDNSLQMYIDYNDFMYVYNLVKN